MVDEEFIHCAKCGQAVLKECYNGLHQINCDFIQKMNHLPKKLVSKKDYEEEIEHVLKPGSRNVVKLKSWQLEGVEKIITEHFKNRHSTILADEMGLGE